MCELDESAPLLEVICRSICNKEDTLEGLLQEVEAFIVSTPDEQKFIQLLETFMNGYIQVYKGLIQETAQYLEKEMKPSVLLDLSKSPKECKVVLTRLQYCFEGINESCEQIEHIVRLYFAHYKKPLREYVRKSEYLQNGLDKLMVSKLIDRSPHIKVQTN